MPTSTRFYAGQTDYIEKLNLTVDEIGGGGGGAVTSVGATSPVVSSGGTTPTISMPAATTSVSGYLTSANWNTFNGKAGIADITVTNLSGTVGFDKGGTGQITQQAAINALTAGVTSGTYLRGNGTNVIMAAIQAADVPTLNQNTTGTAAIATTATTTNDVATATAVYPLWSSANSGNNGVKTSSTKLSFVPSTGILTAAGFAGSGASLTSIPNGALTNSSMTIGSTSIALGATVTTFAGLTSVTSTTFVGALTGNASTATTAGNVTGIIASANGGTGVNNGSSTITLGGNLTLSGAFASTFNVTGITSVTFPTSGTLLSTAAAVTVPQGGTGLTTLTSGSVLVGNGTSSPTLVAPSTSGNVLTSNGTTWVSSPATGGGSAITVKDEGTDLTTSLTSLDFVGAGVTASNTGGAVTVTITGGGGSGGTVTSASVVSANGFAGSVANATTTPAITLSTSVTGLIKGDGTALSAATAGTDYSSGTSALATGILKSTTATGALSIAAAGDFPTLNQNTTGTAANVTGTVAVANGGTGVTSSTGSGSVVLSNTPTLTTPVLGVATATSVNKVAFTAPATGSTLTIANGKTFTSSNTLTFTGTDGSTLNVGTGGTLGTAAYTASTAYAPAAGSASVTTLGTVTTGTWNAGIIAGQYGGTGVNNSGKTLTLGGNHTNSGSFASTFTFTGTTGVTFPTSGTLLSNAAAVTVAQGGTGLATLTANNVMLGNGTSTPLFVAPSTSGNVLTSNGTTWVSSAPAGGGAMASAYVARTSNTILGTADVGKFIDITSGTFSQTFTAAATLGSSWFVWIRNSGTGIITLDPNSSETIDGVTTTVMYPNEVRKVQCTGSGFISTIEVPFYFRATSSGAFTKPTGYTLLGFELVAGGGGGAGGMGGNGTTARSGGSGGGGGASLVGHVTMTSFSTSTSYTVGAGGGGGSASGGTGGNGGHTLISFSHPSTFVVNVVRAYGGGGGVNSSSVAGAGGGCVSAASSSTAGTGILLGYDSGASLTYSTVYGGGYGCFGGSASGGDGATPSYYTRFGGCGGGGGGGVSSGAAGIGSYGRYLNDNTGTPSNTSSTTAKAGGGGGDAIVTGTATAGGAGFQGGGGGGGGSSYSAATGGAGGVGGSGYVDFWGVV